MPMMFHRPLLLLSFISVALSFNISPSPNIVFRQPDKNNLHTKTSSLFGYSLTLRKNSILIGAPKSQSISSSQPGAVYKCNFTHESSCRTYNFNDDSAEEQLLGWAMDGLEQSDDVMTCAPHRSFYNEGRRYPKGLCYKFKPESNNSFDEITVYESNDYNKRTSECGFSVHAINENNFIFGCPIRNRFQGSILLTSGRNSVHELDGRSYISSESEDYYFGYAVDSVSFTPGEISFVVSAPRIGKVFLIDPSALRNEFSGTQDGEYFGYSVLVEDFNGDSLPDLAIGAPYYSRDSEHDQGSVYVYMIDKNVRRK